MQLTKRFRIKPTDELTRLCRANNDLYNQALYHWRQHYEQCGGFMSFYQLESEMRGVKNLEGECNFRLSKERYAHFTVKLVKQDIDSFFAMMKRWKAHPEKFKAKPEFPHFKRHGGMIGIQCDTKGFTIKDGYMMYGFGKEKAIPVPQWEHWRVAFERATLVRFIPQTDYFIMEVVYESEPRMADVTPDRVAAIDLGIDNLATLCPRCLSP